MALGLEEVTQELRCVRNRLRCIDSDRTRDPARVEREHLAGLRPLLEKLERLRAEFASAESEIIHHEERITALQVELKKLAMAATVEKLRRLVAEVNRLDKTQRARVMLQRFRMDRQRVVDTKFLIEGHRNAIRRLNRLLANDGAEFLAEELSLLQLVAMHQKRWDDYCESVLNGDKLVQELLDRHCDLMAIERDLRGQRAQVKLEQTVQQFTELIKGLDPEFVKMVLDS